MKITARIYGSTNDIQREVLDRLRTRLYFKFCDRSSTSFTESMLIKNTVYMISVHVFSYINEIEIYINEHNTKLLITDIELETDIIKDCIKNDVL